MVKALSPGEALLMASAFSNLLSLHNLSEEVANAQLERLQRLGDLPRGSAKSTNGTFQQLVANGIAPEVIYKTLCEQKARRARALPHPWAAASKRGFGKDGRSAHRT